MINFRFHLVSLIAVFLALALGITLGATVIDRALVTGLRDQIDRVEKSLGATDKLNGELKLEQKRQKEALDAIAPIAVQRLLYGRSVLVFAPREADAGSVKQLVDLLQRAEATSPAIVWLEPKWQLPDAATRADLAAALGVDEATIARESRDAIVQRALAAIATRLQRSVPASAGATTTTVRGAPPADVLDALRRAGFVSIERVGPAGATSLAGFGGVGTAAVLIVPPANPAPTAPATTVQELDLVALFGRVLPDRGTSLVVGEADTSDTDPGRRGAALAPIRGDRALGAQVSTVDDVDRAVGRIAIALALSELEAGRVGHYGIGSNATSQLPTLS